MGILKHIYDFIFKKFSTIALIFLFIHFVPFFFYGTFLSTALKIKKLIIKSIVNLSILTLVFSIVLFWNNLNFVEIDYLSKTKKIILLCYTLFVMFSYFENIY